MVHYRTFLNALASYEVFDSSTGTMVALRNHPTLGPIRVSVLGRDHVARDPFDNLATISSYTRSNYLNAVTNAILAVRDEFPSKFLYVGFFSLTDGNDAPPLDLAVLDAIDTEFDGVIRPRIGLFQEVLTGDNPDRIN